MTTKTIATYDMSEDAMGLSDFIQQYLANQSDDDSPVIYVKSAAGAQCIKAELVESTLSDGSKTVDLVLTFD